MRRDGSRMFSENGVKRREFLKAGAAAVAGIAVTGVEKSRSKDRPLHEESSPTDAGLAIRLGIASYTFRNFSRAEMIGFLKQAHVSDMNLKDTKDHLPADAVEEIKALGDYVSAGIKLHAAGTIYFPKDEDADIRAKFEYAKRAGIGVIVAGDPENSPIIRRITATNPAMRMPPVYSGRKLTPQEIDLIRRWIEQGAKWEKHWSFIPPQRAAIPDNAGHPIDWFVRERLKREALAPSPEADRAFGEFYGEGESGRSWARKDAGEENI